MNSHTDVLAALHRRLATMDAYPNAQLESFRPVVPSQRALNKQAGGGRSTRPAHDPSADNRRRGEVDEDYSWLTARRSRRDVEGKIASEI
jgi:hypothetical protein